MASIQRTARRAAQRVKYDAWRRRERRIWRIQRDKAIKRGSLIPSFKGWLQRAAKATGGKLPWIGEKGKPWLPSFLRGLFKVEKVEEGE